MLERPASGCLSGDLERVMEACHNRQIFLRADIMPGHQTLKDVECRIYAFELGNSDSAMKNVPNSLSN